METKDFKDVVDGLIDVTDSSIIDLLTRGKEDDTGHIEVCMKELPNFLENKEPSLNRSLSRFLSRFLSRSLNPPSVAPPTGAISYFVVPYAAPSWGRGSPMLSINSRVRRWAVDMLG